MRLSFLLSIPLVTTLVAVPTGRAENPIIQTKFTADPAPLVYNDTVYLYTSHDEDNASGFTMYNYMLYTSTDMVNWTDHGILAGVKDPYKTWKWADGNSAWAPQVVRQNNRFYMYAPFPKGGRMMIGVAVADKPEGPFVDPLNAPLIDNPNSTGNDIDPTVMVDDDGQAYLYWGHQPPLYYVKLNQDMTSYSGSIVQLSRPQTFEEGPWFFKRDKLYYLAWASTCCPEGIGYAMGNSPTGPWTFKGSIMDGNNRSSGNHPGIVDYKGTTYVFGFNYAISYPETLTQPLPGGHTERRSVCVQKMAFAADGSIPKLPFWDAKGVDQVGTLNPYIQTEAETIAWSKGLKTETCSEGGMDVTNIDKDEFIKVAGVDFAGGATSLDVRVASTGNGGNIEVRLDSQTGTLVGTCTVTGTGGAQTWATKTCTINGASGLHDLFFVFTGGSTSLFNFNWWKFTGSSFDGGTGPDRQDGGDGGASSGGSGGSTGGTIGHSGGGAGSATGGMGGAATSAGTPGQGGASGSGGIAASAGAGGASSPSGTGGQRSSAGGAGGRPSSGGGAGSAGTHGSGGTTSSSVASNGSSGCSCDFGGARRDATGLIGFAVVLGLSLGRRCRRGRREGSPSLDDRGPR